MYKKFLSSVLVCVCFLFCVNFSFAQNETNSESFGTEEDLIIANVDFEDGVIETVSSDSIKISFSVINNHTKVLADMVYAVQIIGTKEGEVNKVMYEYVYNNDHLTISPKNTIHKTANVPIPSYLDGSFKLRLIGRTVEGITLENYIVGEVQLTKTVDEYINNRGCFAYVNDEQFRVEQGVDIEKSETIILKCDISNMTEKDIAYLSEVSVYDKSVYNIKNASDVSSKEGSIEKNSDKEISLEIPTPKESGYYDAALVFLNRDKKQISNKIDIHFVVQGLSGSISDVVFDKNSYNVGEEAKVEFMVSGSADRFPNSRMSKSDEVYNQKMSVQIGITSDNKECSKEIKRELASDSIVSDLNEKIKITRDCHDPIATLILSDENGNVLDKKVLSLLESKGGDNETAPIIGDDNPDGISRGNILKTFSIFTLILILGIIIVLFKRNSKNNPNKIIIFLFGSALLFMGNSAYAGVLSKCGSIDGTDSAYCYYDITPSSVTLGSAVTAEAGMDWVVCKNGELEMAASYNPTANAAPWTNLVNETYKVAHCENTSKGYYSKDGYCKPGSVTLGRKNIFGNNCMGDSKCNKDYFDIQDGHDLDGSNSFTPAATGSKTAYFKFDYYHDSSFNGTIIKSKSYTVTAAVVNGSCGTSATSGTGATTSTYASSTISWPTTDWCSKGSDPAVAPTFPAAGSSVSWTCAGSGGGTSATCTAARNHIIAACGTRNTTYAANIADWPAASTQCAPGTASANPTFPVHGETATWVCQGSNSAATTDDVNCSATHSYEVPNVTMSYAPPSGIDLADLNQGGHAPISTTVDLKWVIKNNTRACGAVGCKCQVTGISTLHEYNDINSRHQGIAVGNAGNYNHTVTCINPSNVSGSASVAFPVRCTNQAWIVPCNVSCGEGVEEHHTLDTMCQDTHSDHTCTKPPCPVSSEYRETKR